MFDCEDKRVTFLAPNSGWNKDCYDCWYCHRSGRPTDNLKIKKKHKKQDTENSNSYHGYNR